MKQITIVFLIAAASTLTLFGQPRNAAREEPGELPSFLFFEPVNLIADDSLLSRLDIQYRLDQNFFVAVKNRDTSSSWKFISRGEILIELFDSLDASKARTIQRVEIGADGYNREPSEKAWYQGMASFEVPPGPYKIVFEVDDLESERRFLDDKTTIRLKRFSPASHEPSTLLFIDWKNGQVTVNNLVPIGFGPHLLFGRKAAVYVEIPSREKTVGEARAQYAISTTSLLNRSTTVVLAETLANLVAVPKVRLERTKGANAAEYSVSPDDSSRALGLIIPLASEKLPLRRFELTITVRLGSAEFKATKSFQMVWPDMPFSLRDIDYAINALKYIATDEQRDSLRRGDLEERRDKLESFWKRRDNTPETSYNEVMVEYYRRADHASKTFGTLREPDGFKSDRGRIYILYGPPTRTERTLSSSEGYQEMWIYENLGKRFIFADQTKTGNYVLIATQSL